MKISYNWIKDFIKIDIPAAEVGEILTDLGLEVEGIESFESIKGGLKGVVVGEVLECSKHPNADKLSLTKVNLGNGQIVPIVCGAPNVAQGQKVAVATIGTTLFDKEGNAFQIKKGKIRGEESHGMICAEDELGLGTSHDGIMVLSSKWEVGTPCSEVFGIETDEVFEIGLTPNRADAMSHFGVARDLRAGLLRKGYTKEMITPSVNDFFVDNRTLKIDVQVHNKELAPQYCGVTISNVKIMPSPQWLQNKLLAIGINPKNNVVDATNYVLHELGQPLHAFDVNAISGKTIVVRTAKAGEKLTTLDGIERTLHTDDLLICDTEKPLCIAGVIGGENSSVTENTTQVFLESAYFNPVSVRKTAKRHCINTDASFRFERGIDMNNCKYALLRAAALIKKIAGGEISSDVVQVTGKKIEDFIVFLTYEKINTLLGQEIPHDEIKAILRSLDIKITSTTERGLGLQVPSYRVDVMREVDVIEEILRVYGYNNIQFSSKTNATMARTGRQSDFKVGQIISYQLVSQGFYEIISNSLTTEKYSELLGLNTQSVKLLNPLSSDLATMRSSMLFSGLETIAFNINRKRNNLKLFEFGKTYSNIEGKYSEQKLLSLFITGNVSTEGWNSPAEKSNFFHLKTVLANIFDRLGVKQYREMPSQNRVFSEGINFEVKNSVVASIGLVSRKLLKVADVKQEVYYAEIQWEALLKLLPERVYYTEIAKFPEVRRDLSLLLNARTSYAELYELAFKTEKNLLKAVSLFDVYQGDKLAEGKKSYAMSFILQDVSKTLTDKQIDKIMERLIAAFEEVGATLRA